DPGNQAVRPATRLVRDDSSFEAVYHDLVGPVSGLVQAHPARPRARRGGGPGGVPGGVAPGRALRPGPRPTALLGADDRPPPRGRPGPRRAVRRGPRRPRRSPGGALLTRRRDRRPGDPPRGMREAPLLPGTADRTATRGGPPRLLHGPHPAGGRRAAGGPPQHGQGAAARRTAAAARLHGLPRQSAPLSSALTRAAAPGPCSAPRGPSPPRRRHHRPPRRLRPRRRRCRRPPPSRLRATGSRPRRRGGG